MPLGEVAFKLRPCKELGKKLSRHRKKKKTTRVTTPGIVIEGNKEPGGVRRSRA